jgi:two-component system chemotaxis response regulator CheY
MTTTTPLDVLIVDDPPAIRQILQHFLRQTNLPIGDIEEAGDGTEAVEILTNRSFGLILSDVNMPRMDGVQLLMWIRNTEHLKNVPVIMITGEWAHGRLIEAVQFSATCYLRKPFTAAGIKNKLAETFPVLRPTSPEGRGEAAFHVRSCSASGHAHPAASPDIGHHDKQKQD